MFIASERTYTEQTMILTLFHWQVLGQLPPQRVPYNVWWCELFSWYTDPLMGRSLRSGFPCSGKFLLNLSLPFHAIFLLPPPLPLSPSSLPICFLCFSLPFLLPESGSPGVLPGKKMKILDCCTWALVHSSMLKWFGNVCFGSQCQFDVWDMVNIKWSAAPFIGIYGSVAPPHSPQRAFLAIVVTFTYVSGNARIQT